VGCPVPGEWPVRLFPNTERVELRIEVTRTRRWTYGYGDPEWVRVMTDDALAALAAEVVDGLTP
jgi:hypothetical protein